MENQKVDVLDSLNDAALFGVENIREHEEKEKDSAAGKKVMVNWSELLAMFDEKD